MLPMPQNRIQALRTESGYSKRQVALAVGVHPSTVGRWESGQIAIPDDRKQHLAEFFGVSVPHLMGWDIPNGNTGSREVAA